MSIDRIAQQFNIGGSTVSEIYKRRTDIECAVKRNKTTGKNRKTMKEGSKPGKLINYKKDGSLNFNFLLHSRREPAF